MTKDKTKPEDGAQPTAEGQADKAAQKPGLMKKLMPILLFGVGGLVLLGGAVYVTLMFLGGEPKAEAEADSKVVVADSSKHADSTSHASHTDSLPTTDHEVASTDSMSAAADSAEAAAELIETYSAEPGYSVIDYAIIDDHSGYLLVDMVEDEQHYNLVVGFAEAVNFGWFHGATAFVREPELWANYFPVIQAIFAHLRTADGAPAPIRLPDSLIDLRAFEVE